MKQKSLFCWSKSLVDKSVLNVADCFFFMFRRLLRCFFFPFFFVVSFRLRAVMINSISLIVLIIQSNKITQFCLDGFTFSATFQFWFVRMMFTHMYAQIASLFGFVWTVWTLMRWFFVTTLIIFMTT